MFGAFATECGYTPAEIRELTLADVERQSRYWKRNPPLHLIAARFAGIKPPAEPMDQSDPSVRLGNAILAGIDRARAQSAK